MASKTVEIRFNAMIRSLRSVGCHLPVKVIPYNNEKFTLPDNCYWWEQPKLFEWLEGNISPNYHRKYSILTESNYQFVDPDIIFLSNPQDALSAHDGFITCCGQWHNPDNTVTQHSEKVFKDHSTNWPTLCFNGGQFACDQKLYDLDTLIHISENVEYRQTLINCETDQPPLNLLVLLSGVKVTNLTLPPFSMESTWSGDYQDNFLRFWTEKNKKPYLIHWAGDSMSLDRKIDQLFLRYLSDDEKKEIQLQTKLRINNLKKTKLKNLIKKKIKELIRTY